MWKSSECENKQISNERKLQSKQCRPIKLRASRCCYFNGMPTVQSDWSQCKNVTEFTYCTRRSVDASLYPEGRRTNVLKSNDNWVVWVAERIFEVIVAVRNVKYWTVVYTPTPVSDPICTISTDLAVLMEVHAVLLRQCRNSVLLLVIYLP